MPWWLRAACPPADGPAAHVDHVLLSCMDGMDVDLVYTHVYHTDVVARTALTARLPHKPTTAALEALTERLGSTVTLTPDLTAPTEQLGNPVTLTKPDKRPGKVSSHESPLRTNSPKEVIHSPRRPGIPSAPADRMASGPPPGFGRGLPTQPSGDDGQEMRSAPPDGARCVLFPGQESLAGVHPAAELVAGSAIDDVVGVGVPVVPGALVDTMGFLRPTFTGGRLVLLVEPAAGGMLRPVEIADPHACCGGH
jgi:hypothetical protein